MRKSYIPIAIIFAIVAYVVRDKYKVELGIGDSVVSYSGSFISAYSLLIAVLEIVSLKSSAELTKSAAIEIKDAIFNLIDTKEMGKAIELIPFIKNAISNNDYGRASSNLEKFSTSYCEIFNISEDPAIPQRKTFDHIHVIIDRLEKTCLHGQKLTIAEIDKIYSLLSKIQVELKIESNRRGRR